MADHPRIPVGPPGLGDSGVEWRSYVLSAGNEEEREEGLRRNGRRESEGGAAEEIGRIRLIACSIFSSASGGRRKEGAMKFILERRPCGQGNVMHLAWFLMAWPICGDKFSDQLQCYQAMVGILGCK